MFRILRFFLGCVNKKERSSVNDFHIIFTVLTGCSGLAEWTGGMKKGIMIARPVEKMLPAASLSPLRMRYNQNKVMIRKGWWSDAGRGTENYR